MQPSYLLKETPTSGLGLSKKHLHLRSVALEATIVIAVYCIPRFPLHCAKIVDRFSMRCDLCYIFLFVLSSLLIALISFVNFVLATSLLLSMLSFSLLGILGRLK